MNLLKRHLSGSAKRFYRTAKSNLQAMTLFFCYSTSPDRSATILKLAQNLRSRRKLACPLCNTESYFSIFGFPPRINAQCETCGSLERHRLLKLYLDRNSGRLQGKKLLHFAPEPALRRVLSSLAEEYIPSAFAPTGNDLLLDIERIDLPDSAVDAVVCSHVLEHVDDRKALHELFRVTRARGVVYLMFPIIEGWEATYEDVQITAPMDRLAHFGQEDHVRMYGRDVRRRITDAGFSISEFTAGEPDVHRYGLARGEKVFICVKAV